MKKTRKKRFSTFLVTALSIPCVAVLCSLAASAQAISSQPAVLTNAVVNNPIQFDVSAPLSDLPETALPAAGSVYLMQPRLLPKLQTLMGTGQPAPTGGFMGSPGPLISATIGLNFDGAGNAPTSTINCPSVPGNLGAWAPPDTNVAVGDTQVLQWVNKCYALFDKATGNLIAGPIAGNHFWAGFGGPCQIRNDGDIIIQWDKAHHRWVASQNTFASPYMTCIAVSQTADATGSYFRYAFPQPGFPDYPKWGLTPNVYYQTQNDFGANDGYKGVNVCAYDGRAMRAGRTAKQICILDNSNGTLFDDSMLPADNDYNNEHYKDYDPTISQPEVLLGSIDNFNPGNTVYEYVFTVNFRNGTASLLGVNGTMPIVVPTYFLSCGGFGACIPQPSIGSTPLDSLGDRLMYRLAHFNNDRKEYWLVTHSVMNTSLAVDARWYQFTAPRGSTSLVLAQSGDTANDGKFRWMGSVAINKVGDIALGYSRSSALPGDFPSIYYAGQTAGDRRGTTESEALIYPGGGSQFDTGSRWGDYSSMALDGEDGCTFWYTTEYYPRDGSFTWATRLASLKFPRCAEDDDGEGEDDDHDHMKFKDDPSHPETGSLAFQDPSQGIDLQSVNGLQSILYDGPCVSFVGDALLNGQSGYLYTFAACDLSALGTGIGTLSIIVTGPSAFLYQKSAVLTSGSVNIYPH